MLKRKKFTKEEIDRKTKQREKDNEFYLSIWKVRKHVSEVSGKWLGNEILSFFFHHILPKENYPEFRYREDNIILLTWQEHDTVENKPNFYKEINKRREKLLKQWQEFQESVINGEENSSEK